MLFTGGASLSKADSESSEKRKPGPTPTTSKRDPNRFYCPYEGCNRSFAELWRLKVHYRAAPDVRGSGKERGHGAELESCPKCGAELKPGRHHVGCAAGKQAAAQQERRRTLKGRKRVGCKESPPNQPSNIKSPSPIQTGKSEDMSTVVGVPVSWMPLDFEQFFLPMQRSQADMLRHDLIPEQDSVDSLIYGNQGELPTMAMAQVGLDSDFGVDFAQFFNAPEHLDPSFGLNFHPVKEEAPAETLEGTFLSPASDPFSEGLDRFLNAIPETEEELLSDITGKKRDRRSSLEQRLERRNGKERKNGAAAADEFVRGFEDRHLLPPHTTPGSARMPHIKEDSEMFGYGEALAAMGDLRREVRLGSTDASDPLMPYSVNSREVGMLVQDLVGCDLRSNKQSNGFNETTGDDA